MAVAILRALLVHFVCVYAHSRASVRRGCRAVGLIYVSGSFYNNYLSQLAKFDFLGMAGEGVLQISPAMIDPDNRNIVAAGSALDVIAYNPRLLRRETIPKTLEDLLRLEFKGKKFVMDIEPAAVAAIKGEGKSKKAKMETGNLRHRRPVNRR